MHVNHNSLNINPSEKIIWKNVLENKDTFYTQYIFPQSLNFFW
jgi:hypothetical protein